MSLRPADWHLRPISPRLVPQHDDRLAGHVQPGVVVVVGRGGGDAVAGEDQRQVEGLPSR